MTATLPHPRSHRCSGLGIRQPRGDLLMRRLLVLAMALTATLTTVGCSDSTGPAGSLAGTYALRQVNGVTPPVTVIATTGYSLEVLAGSIVLDAQGNYTGT